MKLNTLNETVNFTANENGILVYLNKQDDPKNNTFRIIKDDSTEQLAKRGLTHTIKTLKDYEKIKPQYKIDVSWKDWIKISNEAKEKNKNIEFRRALAKMQQDVVKLEKEKKGE